MSQDVGVFLIVEGKVSDPYFADRLCSTSKAIDGRGYEIRLIGQIADESGRYSEGKDAVLQFFEYCRRNSKLEVRNSRGTIRLAFLVDRDSQHITGGMKRSGHLLYTYFADSEAHGFLEGNSVEAIAQAASLDRRTAVELLRDLGDWPSDLANSWRPWIELCYVAQAARSRSWVGLGKAQSHVHVGPPAYRTLDSVKLAQAKLDVRAKSLLTDSEYSRIEKRVMTRIAREYQAGRQAQLLKGKWLPNQLEWLVGHYFHMTGWNARPWHDAGFAASVSRAFIASIPPTAIGFRTVQRKLEALV